MKVLPGVPLFFSILIACIPRVSQAQSQWPREVTTPAGVLITIYQPQPEAMNGDKLEGRAAFSITEKQGTEPVFGVFWYTATMLTNRDARTIEVESIVITDVKLPGDVDAARIERFKKLLGTEVPSWNLSASLDDIVATIETEQAYRSDDLKTDPPVIHYAVRPTILVLIDGEPKVQEDKELKLKRVVNSAFLIIESAEDKNFYLYGASLWYYSGSAAGEYKPVLKLPRSLEPLDQQMKKKQTDAGKSASSDPSAILVSTVPAELIQSRGAAEFASIAGTGLVYISNSDDDIFRAVSDQRYYVLLSGRWYSAATLEGTWEYIASDKLPSDFAKIPEGSPKDNVLASVAGTQASMDAIHDAQVPQTAKVDRKTATCTVTYDGEPKFDKIEGTSLELAMNTSSTVLKSGNKYYCVDKGVWFESVSARGPWKVSTERPKDVEDIPASSPAYNVKYVYIYDSTPEVVYVGYTPGYMGCYVYGPTVVYGTGYYYTPWYGPYYYPRPATYGFSMHYNPWTGWSMGFHYSSGWFSFSMYGGGYWGPPVYRPPYYPPYRGGMYGGRGPTYIHNGDINIDRSNNIYNQRNGVNTRDVQRGQNVQNRPSTRDQSRNPTNPQVKQPTTGRGDVYSDRNGNVYSRDNNGNWNQRQGNEWKQTQQPSQMDRDYQNRQRSTQRNTGYQQMNRGGNLGGGYNRPMGGGGRRR